MYWISEDICTVCDQIDHVIGLCPASAIVKGSPYPAITDACIDCGVCEDECPEGAICELED